MIINYYYYLLFNLYLLLYFILDGSVNGSITGTPNELNVES